MTEDEIDAEVEYRVEERISIMCGDAIPTKAQMKIARLEAQAWKQAVTTNKQTDK